MNVIASEVPPPGAGLVTATVAEPAAATSLAGTYATSAVELTNRVARSLPFQSTAEPATKPVPPTVSVKFGLPAVALAGESDASAALDRLARDAHQIVITGESYRTRATRKREADKKRGTEVRAEG